MIKNDRIALLHTLQKTVDNFHREVLDAAGDLRSYLSAIDDGKMPTAADCEKIINRIISVQSLRAVCDETYQDFGKEELPETFDAFAEEVEQIEKLLDKTEYIEAKSFLLSLEAHDDKVAELFAAVKKDLLALDIEGMTADECKEVMGKYVDLKNLFTAEPLEKVGYMQKLGTKQEHDHQWKTRFSKLISKVSGASSGRSGSSPV